jgi:cell division protein FtsN
LPNRTASCRRPHAATAATGTPRSAGTARQAWRSGSAIQRRRQAALRFLQDPARQREAIPDPKADEANQTAQKQSDAEKEKEKQAKEGALKDPVYLQTGSFQNAADADNQKAKLALMGAEASVQQVMLQDKVWYRVRLGPFKKQDEVNHMRAELSSQGIEANIVKKD